MGGVQADERQRQDDLALGAARELARRVRRHFGDRLRRVVLFGSRARGDWGGGSDVDVLILVDGLTMKERDWVYDTGAEVYMETRIHVAPLALSTAEYDRLRRLERLIVDDIEQQGIDL